MTPDLDAIKAMLDGVERWRIVPHPVAHIMALDPEGSWVHFNRYSALVREVEARRSEVERLRARVAELEADRPFIIGANHGWDEAMEQVSAEARRYASCYPQSSDGRNTFVMLAEWAEGTTRTALNPKETPDAEWPDPRCAGEAVGVEALEVWPIGGGILFRPLSHMGGPLARPGHGSGPL